MKRFSTPLNASSSKKKARTSVYENAAYTAADGMTFLGTSIKEAQQLLISPPQTRFDQCLQVLNEMKGEGSITSKDYFRICRVFMDKESYSALFIEMAVDLRLE